MNLDLLTHGAKTMPGFSNTTLLTIVTSLLTMGTLLAGCAGKHAVLPPAQDTPAMTVVQQPDDLVDRESGLAVGELREIGELKTENFWPTKDVSDRFQRVDKDLTRTVERTLTLKPNDHLELIVTDVETGDTLINTLLQRQPDGTVEIVSTLSEGIESDFDPHALFLPMTVRAGDSIDAEFEVESSGPRIPDGSGKGSVKLRGLGMQRIETGRGIIDAFVVESDMSFGIGPARIILKQTAWIDPTPGGTGLVAEEGTDSVKVFGISVHSVSRVSRILDEEES